MSIYVDQLFIANGQLWCHMLTDQLDLAELHEMAEQIGLQRRWFQNHPDHPHYDLRPGKRQKAIDRGAIEVNPVEMIGVIRARRVALRQGGEK